MYVDAIFDSDNDIIKVVERHNGERKYVDYPVKYTFFYDDPKGKFSSMRGKPLSRVVCKSTKQFRKETSVIKSGRLYESDINPVFRCLSENYAHQESPKLNVAFWDIETDFDMFAYPRHYNVKVKSGTVEDSVTVDTLSRLTAQETNRMKVWDHIDQSWGPVQTCRYLADGKGFATPDDPFMPITAITVYLQWLDELITLAIPPVRLGMQEAQELVASWEGSVLLFSNDPDHSGEKQMLQMFLDIIDDADVISGWNSESYDIPYTVNRISRILSKDDTRRFCLWNRLPKKRTYEKFGKSAETYDTVGRVHLDSLELYRKYTYEERHSYRLDAIGELEIGERKVVYEGTLDQLYNNDFYKFIEYNRQDVALLNKLDKKLKFIDLSNDLAHANTVLMQTTLGAVAVTEQAIINEAHEQGVYVNNRNHGDDSATKAAGAYVAYPKKGLHHWVGSMDLNSLYPSVIRALNMAPETIVGQLRQDYTEQEIEFAVNTKKMSFAEAWEGRFGSVEYEFVMTQRKDKMITIDWEDGKSETLSGAEIYKLIYDSYSTWMLSANGTIFTTESEGIIPTLLKRWYQERKEFQKMKKQAEADGDRAMVEFWDKRQLVKKTNLNSLYGAILNPGCRFFDKRIGQSTTLTGRQITKHMASKVNEIITGEYNHIGEAIIYGDTDSEVGSTVHRTNIGEKTVEQLFEMCEKHEFVGSKEYGYSKDLQVLTYDPVSNNIAFGKVSFIYRHKVSKDLYDITDQYGNTITVTQDHSVMVERSGSLVSVKPTEIAQSDILLSAGNLRRYADMMLYRGSALSVTKSRTADDEYVYDIGMQNESCPWYFGNDILIHNSCYFSAYPVVKDEVERGVLPWSKESVINLYDQICAEANQSFPNFMYEAFHCPPSRGSVIAAGREVVAETGLYITKKRYAALVFDKENKRTDINGEAGVVKAMGLDLRRSDTPVFVQDFLSRVLFLVLTKQTEERVLDEIRAFRTEFKNIPSWEKGTPKRVNNISKFASLIEKKGKVTVPGHVRASINWNTLKRLHSDRHSMTIVDGMKTIVCKLKRNPMELTSVAYPIDQLRLPEWFVSLPFDDHAMEEAMIDSKLSNLIGVLNYAVGETRQESNFFDLFEFS